MRSGPKDLRQKINKRPSKGEKTNEKEENLQLKRYTKIEGKFQKILEKGKKTVKEMLIICFSANLVIIPIILINFNTISFTFFISNLLAGQLLGFCIILGFITFILSLLIFPVAKVFGIILNLSLHTLITIAEICSKLPFSKVYVISPNFLSLLFYYAFLFFIVYQFSLKQKKRRRRIENKILEQIESIRQKIKKSKEKIMLIGFLILLTINLCSIIPQDLKIYFIDVGQRR